MTGLYMILFGLTSIHKSFSIFRVKIHIEFKKEDYYKQSIWYNTDYGVDVWDK